MDERSYQGHLKFDLLAAQHRGCGQSRDLVKCARELFYRLDQRRAFERPLSRFSPPFDGRLCKARLREVMRKQLWFSRSSRGELTQKNLCDAR